MNKAHCDLATGKIYGCKKGSRKWWHEKGHIIFNDEKSFILLLKNYIFFAWMSFVTISFVSKYIYSISATIISWAVYVFIGLYEEWWCNQYANKKYKK